MQISAEGLVIIVVVGLIAGWLACQIRQGSGLGIIADIAIGVVGALAGVWLLPQLSTYFGVGLIAAIADAAIGALILLGLISVVRSGGWLGDWGRSL